MMKHINPIALFWTLLVAFVLGVPLFSWGPAVGKNIKYHFRDIIESGLFVSSLCEIFIVYVLLPPRIGHVYTVSIEYAWCGLALATSALSLVVLGEPAPFAARASRVPAILLCDGTHLVGDTLYEITDEDVVLQAAEQESASAEETLRSRLEQLTELTTARRALLRRAGLPDDAPVARMGQLAAEQNELLRQLKDARARLAERKASLHRRVQDIRTQAELVWQTHQLASIEQAAAAAAMPVVGATLDVSDIQAELARIVEASERAAAAWRAESEVAAIG
jgi:hypothetical protein